jgi:hypothetical protein
MCIGPRVSDACVCNGLARTAGEPRSVPCQSHGRGGDRHGAARGPAARRLAGLRHCGFSADGVPLLSRVPEARVVAPFFL